MQPMNGDGRCGRLDHSAEHHPWQLARRVAPLRPAALLLHAQKTSLGAFHIKTSLKHSQQRC